MRRRSPPQASRCASCVSPGSDRGGISSPTNANHIGYLQVALVKHRKAQTRVLPETATFVNEIKSLWLIDFFG